VNGMADGRLRMEPLYYHRDTCRLCESPEVERVLDMAPCPPVDAFIPASRLNEEQPLFPMDLYLCRQCGHGQLLDVVSPDLLFGNYIYTTASSPGLVAYFQEHARRLAEQGFAGPGKAALDIGSNDGTLLRALQQRGMRVLGVDPAAEIAKAATAQGIETIPTFFNLEVARRLRASHGTFDLVTANNVFAHSDDLASMADGVRELLAPDGVFVFEVSYLLAMVKNLVFDFIYHEHLSHHSVKPLRTFLERHGLSLFSVEQTESKGGTLRCFAQRAGEGKRPIDPSVDAFLKAEEEFGLYTPETYKAFGDVIRQRGDALRTLLEKSRGQGRSIVGYGASATSTVLTYHFQIGRFLKSIIDDNPDRQNRYSPGLHIPIVSSAVLRDERPDDAVILVWRFADMIIQRNQAYLEAGGRFIIPLPTLRVVERGGGSPTDAS
jgi:SAM-dependent methyltransferase